MAILNGKVNYADMSRSQLEQDVAEKLSKSVELNNQLTDLQTAKEHANNQALFLIYAELSKVLPAEEIAALPDPNKDRSQSNNPEIIEKANPKGGKPIKVYFYDDLTDKLDFAAPIVKAISGIEAANADKAGAPVEYVQMSKQDRMAELNLLRTRRSNVRKALRDCIAFGKQMISVGDMDKVGVRLLKDPKDQTKVRNTPRPIMIYSKDDPSEFDLVSAATFSRYDVQKAMKAAENPGTLAALKATGARGARGGSGNASVEISGADDYESVFSDVVTWQNTDGNKGKLRLALEKESGDDLLANMYAMWSFLDSELGKKSKRFGGKTYMTAAEELYAGPADTAVSEDQAA